MGPVARPAPPALLTALSTPSARRSTSSSRVGQPAPQAAPGARMGSQVVTGATLQCSMGSNPSTFAASGTAVSATTAAGVITDIGPENVPPFGLCQSPANPQVASTMTPQPCLPV